MTRKIIVLAVIVAFFLVMSNRANRTAADVFDSAPNLMPAAIGNYRLSDSSRIDLVTSGLDETGVYSSPSGDQAQLQIMLDRNRPHNSLGCAMVRGMTLRHHRLQAVRTANSDAVFDIAILESPASIALVASTECWRDGCDETSFPSHSWILPKLDLKAMFVQYRPAAGMGPVPVTIVMDADPSAEPGNAGEAGLMARFEKFATTLNLAAVRSFAAPHVK